MSTPIAAAIPVVPAYAKASGILALILAIIGFVVPVLGVLFINPLAIILGCVALYGGYKSIGIAVLVVTAVKLAISPTFWLNVAAGAQDGALGNRLVSYVSLIGIVTMIYFAARTPKV